MVRQPQKKTALDALKGPKLKLRIVPNKDIEQPDSKPKSSFVSMMQTYCDRLDDEIEMIMNL